MFLQPSLARVEGDLSGVYRERIKKDSVTVAPAAQETVRGPIGLFLVREDGGTGSKLASEVIKSFGYWHTRTEHFFDGVFLGWGWDGVPVFDTGAFLQCVKDLERRLNWQYKGGADLLLTDFVYDVAAEKGELEFSKTIALNISGLLDQKKLAQLSPLIEDLTAPFKDPAASGMADIMDLAEYLTLLRTREFFWKYLVERIGFLLGWADQIGPYRPRDLRKAVTG
jgi:hypothetical protein